MVMETILSELIIDLITTLIESMSLAIDQFYQLSCSFLFIHK